jgi:hypothetical protein
LKRITVRPTELNFCLPLSYAERFVGIAVEMLKVINTPAPTPAPFIAGKGILESVG